MNIKTDRLICGLIFFSTLAAYNVYWALSLFSESQQKKQQYSFSKYVNHLILILISGLAMLDILWYRPTLLSEVSVAFMLTLLYCLPLLKKQKDRSINSKYSILMKVLLLSLTWTFTTVVIPVKHLDNGFQLKILLIAAERFFFIMMLSVIFEMKDRFTISSVEKRNAVIFMFILLALHSFVSLLFEPVHFIYMGITGALAFLMFLMAIRRKRGYRFFYFFVDGLMLLMAVAGYLTSI